MPFRLPFVARIKEHFAAKKRLKTFDAIAREVSADQLRGAKQGVPEGRYEATKYKPGSTGDLRYHLDRSLKPALIAEFKLSEQKATDLINILNTNSKVSTAFYGVVNFKGRERESAKTAFYAEVNRLLIKYVGAVTPRLKSATTMIVDHHNH